MNVKADNSKPPPKTSPFSTYEICCAKRKIQVTDGFYLFQNNLFVVL